jgi:uncharacterized protein YegL
MGPASSLDMADIVRRQLHVILALDCSGSMRGDRIASLNYALRTALPELRAVATENPEVDVRIRVLRFASDASWLTTDAVPVVEFTWTDLVADGETHFGDALTLMAAALSREAMPGRQLPPVVVVASDGYPTDDFEVGFKAFFAADHAEAAIRIAIAIGSDADTDILQQFIRHPTRKPLRASNAAALVEHIKWATTAPVKAASSPTNAPDPLAPPVRATDLANTADSEIIW